jgi:26S proteasome regulatory subunit N1
MSEKEIAKVPVPAKDPNAPQKEGAKGGKDNKDDKPKVEISEEDLRIKAEVELLVTRVQDSNQGLVSVALAGLKEKLRQATGQVGSIPKPLKFVRPHFAALRQTFQSMTDDANKKKLSDILSLIAMTTTDKEKETNLSLHFKLTGTVDDLAYWGHEYLRHLAGEIGNEWNTRKEKEQPIDDLHTLVHQVVTFMMGHQDEPAACDLALEIDEAPRLLEYCDASNYNRVAQYLMAVSKYVPTPEDHRLLEVVYSIYVKAGSMTNALRLAVALKDTEKVKAVFEACQNEKLKKQLALMCGRFRMFVETGSEELDELVGNNKLSEHFLYTARDLDSLDPKTPEDIYKTHLMDQRQLPTTTNSHMHNLASTFVNAYVNAGFGKDKLMTVEGSNWIFQTKDHRMMSASASIGLIHLWDQELGLPAVDKYSYSEENYIKAGSLLATGLVMCGINSIFDPALSLLQDSISHAHREVRIGAILGLGFAYSGTAREDIKDLLIPLIADSSQPVEVQAFTVYALSLVFAGTANQDISETTTLCLMEKTVEQLQEPCIRYLILGLGGLFLGRQDAADTLLEAIKTLDPVIQRYAEVVVLGCAYAATGSVDTIQKMFHIVAEPPEEKEEEKPKKEGEAAAETDAKPKPKAFNHKAAAIMAIGLISVGEELGVEMAKRVVLHPLLAKAEDSDTNGRRGVPLAMALLSVSNPNLAVIETLSKLSHDADSCTAQSAILGLGLVAAGTNNARVATLLRNLAGYYHKEKDSNYLFLVRVAQGLVCLGKGHITLCPTQSDGLLTSPSALVGLLGLCTSGLDMEKTLLDRYHYMLYSVVAAMTPRMLLTVDENMTPVQMQVRVGTAVDTVAVPGKPKTITGFQTHNTPVLLQETDRAEVATGKYRAIDKNMILEGVCVVEEKPEAEQQ